MSYVRWSTPLKGEYDHTGMKPTSDFYIYEHYMGFYSINVAGNCHRPTKPFTEKKVIDVDPETNCGKPNPAWFDWLEEGREQIDHPAAGRTFEYPSMREVIAKVEELVSEGFFAPVWLLDRLREEEDAVAEPYEGAD